MGICAPTWVESSSVFLNILCSWSRQTAGVGTLTLSELGPILKPTASQCVPLKRENDDGDDKSKGHVP